MDNYNIETLPMLHCFELFDQKNLFVHIVHVVVNVFVVDIGCYIADYSDLIA